MVAIMVVRFYHKPYKINFRSEFMISFKSDISEVNAYRVIEKGDKYGLNDSLTYERDEPLIEFYKDNHFITRYRVVDFVESEGGNLSLVEDDSRYILSVDDIENIKKELLENKEF